MAVITTSGVAVFTQTAVELISAALRACQVLGDEETASGTQLQSGLAAFNLMVKTMQASGTHLWLEEDLTLFLQPGQYRYELGTSSSDHFALTSSIAQSTVPGGAMSGASTITVASAARIADSYTIGVVLTSGAIFWTTVNGAPVGAVVTLASPLPSAASVGALVFAYPIAASRPLKAFGARRFTYATGAEIPLIPMSRLDYPNLTMKGAVGVVANFFFDPQTGHDAYGSLTAIMTVYPPPADATSALRFTAQRPIQDFANLANMPDFPAEWLAALKWTLAMELALEYGIPNDLFQMIKQLAEPKLALLEQWDREQSGTTTYPFSQAVYQLIAGALRLCGGSGPQDVPTLGQANNALFSLNALVQNWQAMGLHVWTQETLSFPVVAGQAAYQIGVGAADVNQVRPLRVTGARMVVTSTQEVIPLIPMSRLDYANLSGKTVPRGQPKQFFYDPQIPYGILSLFPAPADLLSTVELTAQRPLTTFTDLSSASDFPAEWQAALRFGLALDLAPEYKLPPDQFQALKTIADEKMAIVARWDQEAQGTSTYPFSQGIYRLIARALRLANACGPQDVPLFGLVQNGFTALNAMIQEWQASGIHVWCEEEAILFPQPGQVLYYVGGTTPDHVTLWDTLTQTALAVDDLNEASKIVEM